LNNEPDRVDVSQLSESQRDMLWMRLRADDVLFAFDGQTVTVRNTSVEELTSALSWVENDLQPMAEDYATPRPLRRVADDGSVVAARWRRLAGWFIDSAVVGVTFTAAQRLGMSWWMLLPLSALYTIGMTHTCGRTVGKFAAGTEVVDQATGALPSWSQAAFRWGTIASVSTAYSLFGSELRPLLALTQIAIYAPILWDPRGRGLHDVAAKTYVRAVARLS
jgi:uncharacterized RDD family membrane protein YckC